MGHWVWNNMRWIKILLIIENNKNTWIKNKDVNDWHCIYFFFQIRINSEEWIRKYSQERRLREGLLNIEFAVTSNNFTIQIMKPSCQYMPVTIYTMYLVMCYFVCLLPSCLQYGMWMSNILFSLIMYSRNLIYFGC